MPFVQGAHSGTSAPTNPVSATFGAAVTAGNTVVGVISFDSAGTLNSITDNKGNTYVQVDNILDATNAQRQVSFRLGNITNGPTVISANFAAATGANGIVVGEWSGTLAASDPTDGHTAQLQTSVGTGTDAVTSGNITTTSNGDQIVGITVCTSSTTTTATAGTGETLRVSETTFVHAYLEDKTQASAGAVASTFTAGAAGQAWATFTIALKPATLADTLSGQQLRFL